ncbi:MAG: CBS domain-containing protein, partial [Desulfarculaceae bacterium]
DDTVEHAIIKGQRELIRNYPVVEEGRLVGLVSSYELFEAVSQILGADEVWCGITFEPMKIEKDTIAKVASLMVETGAFLHGIFTMHLPDTDKKRIILRFDCDDLDGVVEALKKAGYSIWEVKRQVQGCLAENGAKA